MKKTLTSRAMRTTTFVLSCFVVLLSGRSAHASPLLDLVGDSAAQGGLQPRTVPGGAAAAYFNPALLIDGEAEATIGFLVLSQHIGVQLYGRPGTQFAILDRIESAVHADGTRFDNYPIPTNDLQNGRLKTARKDGFTARPRQGAGSGHDTITYEVVGLLVKLFNGRLAIGMHLLVPNGEFTKLRTFFNDEREQYFSNSLQPELFSDRMTALSLGVGAGVKITDNFSLGAGATLSLQANVVAPTYVIDTGNLGKIAIDMNASVNIGVSPYFGASYKFGDRFRLVATAHAPQRVELGASFTFLLSNGIEQASSQSFTLDYTPWQVALGASFDIVKAPDTTFTVAATGLYAAWSSYIDRHGETPVDAYAWADTISPTLGFRWRLNRVRTLLDVSYVPTPIPKQTGRTNYVDNDRISSMLGAEYVFPALGTTMRFGAQAQLHCMLTRYQTKLNTPTSPDGKNLAPDRVKDEVPDDAQISGEPLTWASGLQTNNPGWPGFSSGGWILGASAYFAVSL